MLFKIAVIGGPGVGKSTFLMRHLTGEFMKSCNHSINGEIKFNTDQGIINFNCHELNDLSSLTNFDGVILMVDSTDQHSINAYETHLEQISDIPNVVCFNKSDISVTEDHPNGILMSAKFNYNFTEPFSVLAGKLLGRENVEFREMPPIEPPEIQMFPTNKAYF